MGADVTIVYTPTRGPDPMDPHDTVTIGQGLRIERLGLGLVPLGNFWRAVSANPKFQPRPSVVEHRRSCLVLTTRSRA